MTEHDGLGLMPSARARSFKVMTGPSTHTAPATTSLPWAAARPGQSRMTSRAIIKRMIYLLSWLAICSIMSAVVMDLELAS
jgi:hypothetical protein